MSAPRADTPRRGGPEVVSAHVVTTDSASTRVPADDAADLYVGDRYLGSLYDLAAPADLLDDLAPEGGEGGEDEFEATCGRMLDRPSSGSTEWPWSTVDSTSTPWSYVYRARSVQVYRLGRLFAVLYPGHSRPRARAPRSNPFPQMRTESDESAPIHGGETAPRDTESEQ